MRMLPLVLAVLWLGFAAGAPAAGAARDRVPERDRQRAAVLLEAAKRHLADGRIEQRQRARDELEEAVAADPGNTDAAVLLASVYVHAGMVRRARRLADELVERDSSNGRAQLVLGQAWRRDWLATSAPESRDRAIVCLARGVRLQPDDADGWTSLVPLLLDANAVDAANTVAGAALQRLPSRPEVVLLAAASAQRSGAPDLADRLFASAIPKLDAASRERFEDVAPLLPAYEAMRCADLPPDRRAAYAERLWDQCDPDLTTPVHEARLEFDARVTQALMLYGPAHDGRWDLRAQYYVRYGAPSRVDFNVMGPNAATWKDDWLLWTYEPLGMRVWMGSSSATVGYGARLAGGASGVAPAPESLAAHPELFAVQHGRGVFHVLPPGRTPMDVRCTAARFQADGAGRLVAWAEAGAGPERRLTAEWSVRDSANAEVAHGVTPMAVSACRPGDAQAATFAAPLPPGRYRVGVRVEDEHGGCGVAARRVLLPAANGGLAVSDLVVLCGAPGSMVQPGAGLRLDAATGLFPETDDKVHAYVEIYSLAPGASGDAEFEYVCTVRPLVRDPRPWLSRVFAPLPAPAPIEVRRRETSRDAMRRQIVSLPVGGLPAGTYEIAVEVRDTGTGGDTRAVATFVRDPAAPR